MTISEHFDRGGNTPDSRYACHYSTLTLLFIPAIFFILLPCRTALALECIQCDRQGLWYSPEENQRHIVKCQRGLIEPTRCSNISHTHCIFNYYKQDGVVTVTERRCGIEADITGCTLYKSIRRMRRHLIGGSGVDSETASLSHTYHRRRETLLLVEVCTGGCTEDGCLNGFSTAAHPRLSILIFTAFFPIILLLFYYMHT